MKAPPMTFLINEDELSWNTNGARIKRAAVLALAEELDARVIEQPGSSLLKASVDGIGVQSHLSGNLGVPSRTALETWVQEAHAAGLEVHVSELDVKYTNWDDGGKYAERAHADLFGDFLSPILKFRNVRRLGFWGLSDGAHFFRQLSESEPDEFINEHAKPTLFDDVGMPKLAAFEIQKILRAL